MMESPRRFSGEAVPVNNRDGELSPLYQHGPEIGDSNLAGFVDLVDRSPVKEPLSRSEQTAVLRSQYKGDFSDNAWGDYVDGLEHSKRAETNNSSNPLESLPVDQSVNSPHNVETPAIATSIPELSDSESKPALNFLRGLLLSAIDSRNLGSYSLYIHNVGPDKITAALVESGFSKEEADKIEQKIFTPKVFSQNIDPAFVANQVKRKLQEVYNLALEKNSNSNPGVAEAQNTETTHAFKTEPSLNSTDYVDVPLADNSKSQLEIVEEQELGPSTLSSVEEYKDTKVFQQNDLSQKEQSASVVGVAAEETVIEPFILTSDMEVGKDVPRVANEDYAPVKLKDLDDYTQSLDILSSSAETSTDKYLEFVYSLHVNQRALYDKVMVEAHKSLKYPSSIYTPSSSEKLALRELSLLQKFHMETAALRESVVSSFKNNEENEVAKNLTRQYLERCKQMSDKIKSLSVLIEKSKEESRPPLAEAYRNDLTKMSISVDRLVASLRDSGHPLFSYLQNIQTSDLPQLMEFTSVEKGGDTAVLEQSTNFIARRDRIKAFISYLESEQAFKNFTKRAERKVLLQEVFLNKLELDSDIDSKVQSERKVIEDNLAVVKNLLTDTAVFTTQYLAESSFHSAVKEFNELTNQINNFLQESDVFVSEIKKHTGATESETEPKLDMLVLGKNNLVTVAKSLEDQKNELTIKLSPDRMVGVEKLINLLGRSTGKLGRIAALVAAVNAVDGQKQFEVGAVTPEVVSSYLRTIDKNLATSESISTVTENNSRSRKKVLIAPESYGGVEFTATEDEFKYAKDFSTEADVIPRDPAIQFESKPNIEVPIPSYTIEYGDNFWNMTGDHSLVAMLPSLKLIKEDKIPELVGYMKISIDSDQKIRQKTGIGKGSDNLSAGQEINMTDLDALLLEIAVNRGYLK